jgi:hypothetical protein
MTDRRRSSSTGDEKQDWEYPQVLRAKVERALPRSEKALREVVARLRQGELWLASIVEWGLRTLAAYSEDVLDRWVAEGMAALDRRLDRLASQARKPKPCEAERARDIFERCCKQFGAYHPLEWAFLLQKHRIPAVLVKRLIRADWSGLPDGKRLHPQVVAALRWYESRLDSEERGLLERLITGGEPDSALPGETAGS